MTRQSWMTWIVLVLLLWICPDFLLAKTPQQKIFQYEAIKKVGGCFLEGRTSFVVADNFNGVIKVCVQDAADVSDGLFLHNPGGGCSRDYCLVFLQQDKARQRKLHVRWPQIQRNEFSDLLYISKWHTKRNARIYVLRGRHCHNTTADFTDSECVFRHPATDDLKDSCQINCVRTKSACKQSTYEENSCTVTAPQVKDKYIINLTKKDANCVNCDNPVKKPDEKARVSATFENDGGTVDAGKAVELMREMSSVVDNMNGSSAELYLGEGVRGTLVREIVPEEVEEVSFAYTSPNESINIIESRESLTSFSRYVTVSKEAFQKAVTSNITVPFAAVIRFRNLTQDKLNSTVLGNEVLAVEMGASIINLTDKINISFKNVKYEGIPSCHSWDGEGSRPNWTGDGCATIQNGSEITCQCSHLTFFAILLTPLNETISSSDLNNLTIITQVGCGLSMFFLSIVLFMHFLLRRTKATKATKILIHLVSAMFLLNLTFLINNFVAKLKNSVGCKIMAALMHYFMLATFTWFAVQAFHLILQLYMGGKVIIRRYMLKVCITSWILPSVVGIVLLILGKYGEQIIHTDNTEDNVAMCWITDNDVHYAVNIGYYALVFVFTFTIFIIAISWLCCLKRTKAADAQANQNGKSIITVMGLCSMLGITWGFAFFAYGVLRVPSYYIFTILNSFQGFFLFIYYYNTSHSGGIKTGLSSQSSSSSSSIRTLKTSSDSFENPYSEMPVQK